MTDIEKRFTRSFNCEIQENSELAPIKEAKEKGDLEKILNAVSSVKIDKTKEKIVKSGLWIFRITWNDDMEKPQVSCYGYKAGITYKEDNE